MAKNEKFKRTYVITVEGVTTNDFASKLIEDVLFSTVWVIDKQHKQISASITRLESESIQDLKELVDRYDIEQWEIDEVDL